MIQRGGQAGDLVFGSVTGDDALVEHALRDPQQFWLLYERYVDAIYWYAVPRLGSQEAADDVVSETMLAAFEHLDSFDPAKGSFSTWLFVIARRKIADHHRYHRRLWRFLSRQRVSDERSVERDSLERVIRDEEIAGVFAAFERLAKSDQDALALRYSAGLSTRQMADVLGASEDAIRQRLARARKRLAVELEAGIGGDARDA